MKDTLRVLNELERDGIISRYAIGGAVAAIFYVEATETEDLDIFVHLEDSGHPLMPMAGLYEELRRRGYAKDGIYDLIEGIPVQFLPDSPALITEAVCEASTIDFDGVHTRLLTAEYLVAIMVQTGRLKDQVRAQQMREQTELDEPKLEAILIRYNLFEKYELWKQQS
jgi:hypothetical protein